MSALAVTVYDDVDGIPAAVRAQLVDLVARVFPDEPLLRGTFYYMTRPDFVVVGAVDGAVVGLRPVVRRTITARAGRPVRIAGGVIPTIDPAHRGRGHARTMTEVTLAEAVRRGDELALAFLFPTAPHAFLGPFGFSVVDNGFSYADPATGADVTETMRAYGRALTPGTTVEDLLGHDPIHLGRGTW